MPKGMVKHGKLPMKKPFQPKKQVFNFIEAKPITVKKGK